ncbi:winged helix-turn-helix domain-containing protein (plasmid) [Bacillus salacetis]|uniref:winged helix-turn-helix domain-containing protein n=1 Tax=Bacillus salacetis TaxID=2315464 RepID=UPI003B9EC3D6
MLTVRDKQFRDEFSLSSILIRNFGERMPALEFYKFLFREYIEDVKAYGFLSDERLNFSSCLPFQTPEEAKRLEIFASHFSISLYYKQTSRLKENIRYMVAIPFDIDWGKKGIQATASEVWQWIYKNTGLEISALWGSKTRWCYHGVLRIEVMVGTPKSIHLLEWVAKELAKAINADVGGTNSNQWLRIGSGSKFEKYSDKVYNIDELKKFLPGEDDLQRRQKAKTLGVTSLEKYRVENHPAIEKLLSGNIVSWRNHACFTAALMLKVLGYSQDEAYERLSGDWFKNVNGTGWDKPFRISEVKSSVKSAFSGKYKAPSKEWIYNVTEEEFPYNLVYVRTKYKKADEVRVAIVNYLRENGDITAKQEELAEYIEMPYRSVQKELKWLKDNEIIEYKAARGRHSKGTTFKLRKNDVFNQNNVVVEVDFDYKELEEDMG